MNLPDPNPTPNIEPLREVNQGEIGEELPKGAEFRSYMEGAGKSGATTPTAVTPLDLAKVQPQMGSPTVESIQGQIANTQDSINSIRSNLQTPNLTLKRSEQYLLSTKLTDANNYIKTASSLIGAKILPPSGGSEGGPIDKFLSYLTDGEQQLSSAQKRLSEMATNKENFNPAELLLVQVKVTQAQQEIEYASVLMSKTVDMAKQLMSLQI